jgi:hypothetical protein
MGMLNTRAYIAPTRLLCYSWGYQYRSLRNAALGNMFLYTGFEVVTPVVMERSIF